MGKKLNTGDSFPRVKLQFTDGSRASLPDDLRADVTVVLFYRGHW
jgi:peroxiredoxin